MYVRIDEGHWRRLTPGDNRYAFPWNTGLSCGKLQLPGKLLGSIDCDARSVCAGEFVRQRELYALTKVRMLYASTPRDLVEPLGCRITSNVCSVRVPWRIL
jgi:hypothetical protein